jgi:drug/metabolite transporter (DMT)-like permease
VSNAVAGVSSPKEHRGRGILLRIGGVTAFASMMAAFKYSATHGVGPAEILFYRNFFSLPTIVAWVLLGGGFTSVRTKRPAAHATRSIVGLAVMCCTFVALSMLPLAEATAISFSAPLFATMLSAIFLRERVMWHRWGAVALGFAGVLIIVHPGGSVLPPLGVAIGLVAAFGAAVVVITLRQLGSTESAAATVFWFNVICVAATALPMPFLFRQHSPGVWAALSIGGMVGGSAQIMMTAALRYAPVSVLAPFDYLQIIWATIWGFILFATLPTIDGVVGTALIAGAGCYVVWRERRIRQAILTSPTEL